MVPYKERDERARSIRAHLLAYSKTGSLTELGAAHAELVILMRLEGVPRKEPLTREQLTEGVVPGLTGEEIRGFTAAIRDERESR